MRIAFAGNPNSGKTTMFNALTGRNEKVGNWAGVTVDTKEAPIRKNFTGGADITAVDLPGAYSMSAYTSEESVTSDFIRQENIDVIINIVDATNLSRSLFFTTQLLELGIPLVVALNKADLTKNKTRIDVEELSRSLGCPVVETVSTDFNQDDLAVLIRKAISRQGQSQISPYVPQEPEAESREAADRHRFTFVNSIVSRVEKRRVHTREQNFQDSIDTVLTHPIAGLGIFAAVMFLVFGISQAWVGPWIADTLVAWLEAGQETVAGVFESASPILQALLVDGIIGGVIAVIGFLPLVMVMYFLISLLEDCGYMARATVVLDPIFKKVGLSGKSVIPFIIGTGCAIPGVMACRTIRDERERRATAMLAPFMPCGAKLPVISLFAGAFFENAPWVGTLMYFVGIAVILLGALLVNRITNVRRGKSYFIIELPEYRAPSLIRAVKDMCTRGWSFIVKAFTIILLCNTVVQIMQTFTWNLQVAETAGESILASIAGPFAYLLVPVVGVVSWQLAAAAITGFIAKENVVGTLAVCFVGLENLINAEELEMMEGAGAEVAGVMAITRVAALAYLMFNLFTPPCFAALGAMNAELNDRKWFWGGVALQFATGFILSFLVYQVGTLITLGTLGEGFLPGLIAVAVIVAVVIHLCVSADKKFAAKR